LICFLSTTNTPQLAAGIFYSDADRVGLKAGTLHSVMAGLDSASTAATDGRVEPAMTEIALARHTLGTDPNFCLSECDFRFGFPRAPTAPLVETYKINTSRIQ